MEDSVLLYTLGSILIVVAIVLIFLWLENIIKIILGNYILGTICFSISMALDSFIVYLQTLGDQRLVWFSSIVWVNFFTNGHATIILLLYILLLVLLYKKSTLSIRLPSDVTIQKTLYIVFVPLAVTSVILTLYILAWWSGIVSPVILNSWASGDSTLVLLSQIFSLTPLWIAIHGLATLITTAEFPVRIQTDLPDLDDL
jgi:hypothetical protein